MTSSHRSSTKRVQVYSSLLRHAENLLAHFSIDILTEVGNHDLVGG